MKEFGYIIRRGEIELLIEQLENFVLLGCGQVYIEANVSLIHQGTEFRKLYQVLKEGDVLVIPELSMIGETDTDLSWFINQLKKKNIILRILRSDSESALKKLKASKLKIITDQVINDDHFNSMKCIGRPGINKQQIKDIINYRVYKKLTYREISQVTNLSLGTVYKYVKEYEEIKK